MPEKVLVTGIAGFIGSHVASGCLRAGYDVVGLDDLSGGSQENVPKGVHFVRGTVCDDQLVERLFSEHKFEAVYHLAAYAAEGLSHFIRRFNYENNLIGSATLINAVVRHEVKCFVFASSIAVYGRNQLPMHEDLTPLPEDPYGIAKYAVELDLKAAHEMFGLDYVIFRPHNVYGPRQNIADTYRNVIGIFMNQALQGLPMTIFGDGLQTRAFSYVEDMIDAIVRSARIKPCYGEVFNVGANKPYTILELAEAVSKALNIPLRVAHLDSRNEVQHAYASHEKVKNMFGNQHETSLEDGLANMAKWVSAIGPAVPTRFENIEVTRNLPASWKQ
jgi:UDP-glucose 4-epimerase